MRVGIALCVVLCAMKASAQVWEKYVAPGLTYRMEVDLKTPRVIHGFRYSIRSSTQSRAELTGLTVYDQETKDGRETLGDLVRRTGAIAGINADFFPFTGDPLGIMVRDGEFISSPMPNRASFGWGPESAAAALAKSDIRITARGATFSADGLNRECGVNEICLFTEASGFAIAEKGPAAFGVIQLDEQSKGGPTASLRGRVVEIRSDIRRLPVGSGTVVIAGSGDRAESIRNLQKGDEVSIAFAVGGFDWTRIKNAVGGGPFLVRNGVIDVDWEREGFKADFATKRHPRSVVGRTADGDLWFVSIDGRQSMSGGATLDEAAEIMLRLGCVEAINLDGGGSTTINLLGLTLNRPSDGQQRPVANAILFFGRPQRDEGELTLMAPEKLAPGDTVMLKVHDSRGESVSNREVIWSAQGKAWIDQGGALRGLGAGDAWVFAYARGKMLMQKIVVTLPSTR